ncbi:formyltetrahydrofolate deformylase [Mesorhizobium loti]|uniref:Formyltetrahydrofolate deformylase n=1 Tax=Rhizobium loti TaxID=381 RepID=A0A124GFE9_RHILI|nr:formyltetrahydrofolate deformylase [Mesorhizobium loti]
MSQLQVLTLTCDDRPGVVAAVATGLTALGANISESSQFWDRTSNRFFMRLAVEGDESLSSASIEDALKPATDRFGLWVQTVDARRRPKIIILVSKFDHAMLDLLYQIKVGWLNADVVAIVSNHEDSREIAEREGIAYHYWPVCRANKTAQEKKVLDLVLQTGTELVILARYMQVLSDDLSTRLFGKIINIHHSFLPSFKGAKPYHQAYARGVKLIGATAHYVTPDLDEGPIIEQETERVTHAMSAEDFVATGRDIESRVLARAVKLHLERRIMLSGNKTIVFSN